MADPRRAVAEIYYEGKNVTKQIREYVCGFSYTDAASGESDAISLELADREGLWRGSWKPAKGDHLTADIRLYNWCLEGVTEGFSCGTFLLDDLSGSGGGAAACSIGAVSIPQDEAFNNKNRTKTWEKITIEEIGKEIAARAGISLFYEAESIPVSVAEQNEQPDCAFLSEICRSYGLAMKVYNNRIILYDEELYEKKEAVMRVGREDVESYSYHTAIKGTYTGATFSYTDPLDQKDHIIDIGGGSRILELNSAADNIRDAERKAIAALHEANKYETTMNMTIFHKRPLYASQNIEVTGFGWLNGTYFIDKITHSLSGQGGYTMSLELRLVKAWIKNSAVRGNETAREAEPGAGSSYTVKQGDTIFGIAKQFYGSGIEYIYIYQANREIIESAAKSRGKKGSSGGHWIFPGTKLTIPPTEGDKNGGD